MSTTTIGPNASFSRGATVQSSSNLSLADPFDETTVTWTELTSSTPEDWVGFDVDVRNSSTGISGVSTNCIFLIATGAASSESRIATIFPFYSYRSVGASIYVPVSVPSGTRISVAAVQGAVSTWYCTITGHHASEFDADPGYSVMDAGPFDLDAWATNVNPSGWATPIDPGASANTKGSYIELSFTGGTNRSNNTIQGNSLPHTYQLLGFQAVDLNDTIFSNVHFLYDVATGAASSEVNIRENIYHSTSTSETVEMAKIAWVKGPFSSGTRISARAQADISSAGEREFQLVMYGVR